MTRKSRQLMAGLMLVCASAHSETLTMANQLSMKQLTAISASRQLASPTPVKTTPPVAQETAWVADLDKLPATAAGRMTPAMEIKPSDLRKKSEATFDFSINDAPASQVFLQLGNGTGFNVLLSPELKGNVSLQMRGATVYEALDALRELYGYDYRIKGKTIMVYTNSIQTRVFKINYLPGRRQGVSDLRVSGSSISSVGSSSESASSSSNSKSKGNDSQAGGQDSSHVRTTSDADFWQEIRSSLMSLLGDATDRSVVMNASAGVIVVRATPNEHRAIADFLKAVQLTVERQVMLEAKIIEVTLSSGSQTGVNWTAFRGVAGDNRVAGGAVSPGISLTLNGDLVNQGNAILIPDGGIMAESTGLGFYGLALQARNFTALINFLETQGDVHVLSSPRIATINNQKAILKVGSDELFITGIKTETTTSSNGGNPVVSPTLTLQPFFSGISLDVTPQIDEDGTVMLHVHPAVSDVKEKQKIVDLGDLGTFKLPLAASAINETDSIVRVNNGHIVAIGGLMTESNSNSRGGIKGLNRLPVVGEYLFGQKSNSGNKRELVILIKPTVIGEDGEGWQSAPGIVKEAM
jgi:MSHA biogenesis protein MshL